MVAQESKKFELNRHIFLEPKVALVAFEFNNKELAEAMGKFEYQLAAKKIIYLAQDRTKISILTPNSFAEVLAEAHERNLIMYKKNLSAMHIIVPDKTAQRPGFLAEITSKLAKENINIFTILTVYNKVIFAIDQKETLKVKKLLDLR